MERGGQRPPDGGPVRPLAGAHLGRGEVACANGLRFVVPVRTLHAGWNRKYFGSQRGVTYYDFTSDQFTGFHGIVMVLSSQVFSDSYHFIFISS